MPRIIAAPAPASIEIRPQPAFRRRQIDPAPCGIFLDLIRPHAGNAEILAVAAGRKLARQQVGLHVAGGALLLWQHKPLLAAWERASLPDAKRIFERSFAFADKWVRKAIVATHTPSLQRMLLAP